MRQPFTGRAWPRGSRGVAVVACAACAACLAALAAGPGPTSAVRGDASAAPAPVASRPASQPAHGLTGHYFAMHAGESWLDDDRLPVPSAAPYAVRVDPRIAFGRGSGFDKPVRQLEWWPAKQDRSHIGVIWTGYVRLPKAGTYYFPTASRNASAVYVNRARVTLNGTHGGRIVSDHFVIPDPPRGESDMKRYAYVAPVSVDAPRDVPIEVRFASTNMGIDGFGVDLYWVTPDSKRDAAGKPVAELVPTEALFVDAPGPADAGVTAPAVSGPHSTISSDFLYFPAAYGDNYITLTIRLADEKGRPVPGKRVHVSGLVSSGSADEIIQPVNPTDANGITTARVRAGAGYKVGHDSTFYAADVTGFVDVAQVGHVKFITSSPAFLPLTYAPYYDDKAFVVEPMPLQVGRPARITIPLENREPRPAELKVTFLTQGHNIGKRDWGEVGKVESVRLEPGETREVSVTWTPQVDRYVCIKVEVFGQYLTAKAGAAGSPVSFASFLPEGGQVRTVARFALPEGGVFESVQRNIGTVIPPSHCDLAAGKLRDQYKELGEKLSRIPLTVFPEDREAFRQKGLDEYERLKKQWDALSASCAGEGIDIGDLEGTELPTLPPRDPEQVKREWKEEAGRLAGVGRDSAADARATGKLYYQLGSIAAKLLKIPGFGATGAREAVDQEFEKQAKRWEDWASRWDRAANDPPSPDFEKVVEPDLQPATAPADGGAVGRLSSMALEARGAESAYLDAYVTSYERYQGARTANNEAGMRRQADAMARFARAAITQTRRASAWELQLERTLVGEWTRTLDSAPEGPETAAAREALKPLTQRSQVRSANPPDLGALQKLLQYAALLQKREAGAGGARRPLSAEYVVANPYDREETIDLRIRRAALPAAWKLLVADVPAPSAANAAPASAENGWVLQEVKAGEHYRVRLPAKGQVRVASVVVPVGAIGENTTARWAVEGYIRDELLGGMMHELAVPAAAPGAVLASDVPGAAAAAPLAPARSGSRTWVLATVTLIALAVVIGIFLLVSFRRRKGQEAAR